MLIIGQNNTYMYYTKTMPLIDNTSIIYAHNKGIARIPLL